MSYKKNNFKISVIIPCFNQGKYLDQAIQSVLNQTYQDFEIIVIDDGSTDRYTKELLKNYERAKTTIYRTANKGASSARNYGYSLAKGNFIQFLDADDFLDKNKFEEQIRIFKNDESIDVCYTDYRYFIEETKEYRDPYFSVKLSKDPLEDFLYRWQRGLSIPIHSAMFRKKIWKSELPFIEGFGVAEDWIMWTKLAKQKAHFFFINKKYAFYRIHRKSMTHNKDYVIYWATRAISYIGENFIEKKDMGKYNFASEKYVKQLINEIYIDEKNQEISKYKNQLEEIYKSISWKITKPLRKFSHLIDLIRTQGLVVTTRNIILKILGK